MKTPLPRGDEIIREVLREQWHLAVTEIHFIPMGDSAYSYRIETQLDISYYLKVVDQNSAIGWRTARHMNFSLPLQRLIAEYPPTQFAAPLPEATVQGALYALQGSLLFALYTFIHGETLADAYPMSTTLVQRIGQALACLHAVQVPESLQRYSPQDNLSTVSDADLCADLALFDKISSQDAPYLQRLREVVWPKREQIRAFLAHSDDYARKVQQTTESLVICHGDAWGGNIILSPKGHPILLDWEAAVMAPPERDAFIYMGGPGFAVFDVAYRMFHNGPMHWNTYRLAYYSYRLQLRNLAHWLHNLFHESLDEVQRDNDVTMIEHHCLDRLEQVERTAATLVRSGVPQG